MCNHCRKVGEVERTVELEGKAPITVTVTVYSCKEIDDAANEIPHSIIGRTYLQRRSSFAKSICLPSLEDYDRRRDMYVTATGRVWNSGGRMARHG